jgi:hypothetical protein
MSRPKIEPGLPAWEVSTLEKSHLDSLYVSYSEPLIGLRAAQHPASTCLFKKTVLEVGFTNSFSVQKQNGGNGSENCFALKRKMWLFAFFRMEEKSVNLKRN